MPYGMASVPAVGGVPGMTGVAGMPAVPGMTPVQAMSAVPGMSRVSNGMGSLYQTEKPSSLYPAGTPTYQGLTQAGYLAQVSSPSAQQTGYLAAAQHPSYLAATSPPTQRYMVSPAYPGAGYSLTAGGYALSPQLSGQSSSALAQAVPVATSSLASPSQAQYPTYIGSQLGPMQLTPSQSAYASAASATGHPLYPSSYTGLPIQQASVQPGAPVPTQIPGRLGPAYSSTTGLPLGYPY